MFCPATKIRACSHGGEDEDVFILGLEILGGLNIG